MLTDNRCELWILKPGFDDLRITGSNIDPTGNQFSIHVLNDDLSWGSPEAIDVEIQRWMAQGAVAATQGNGNRTLVLTVSVAAPDPADLGAGETALVKRSDGPCLLKWVGPSGDPDAPATIFEVWTWHLSQTFDPIDELNLQRLYTLTFTAKPNSRSEGATMVNALPSIATPNTVSVDACTSVTGWTGSPNSPVTSGGSVKVSQSVLLASKTTRTYVVRSDRTFTTAVALGSTPFVVTDITLSGASGTYQVIADGVILSKVASLGPTAWWSLPPGVSSFKVLSFIATFTVPKLSLATMTLAVNDISRTDSPGGIGTHRQLFRSMDVGGSVPTSGSIQVASPSATGLGNVLVYTSPDNDSGYVPAMRRYRTAGMADTLVVDASTVSGARERLERTGLGGSPAFVQFTIPVTQLVEANYAVVARLKCDAVVTEPILLSSQVVGGGSLGQVSADVAFAAANTWQFSTLGILPLPPSPVPAEATGNVNVLILGNILDPGWTAHTVTLDELYLFDITHGAVSIVNAGTFTRLWLDAPDADPVRNRPAIYLGTKSDRTDAVGATADKIVSMGFHDLDPDGAAVFTVTDGVLDAGVTASFYKRWHTHAGA
jgi:hypothetical protein